MTKLRRWVNVALPVVAFSAAIWLLYYVVRKTHWSEVRSSLAEISATRMTLALGLVVLNYVILFGYDYLALRSIGRTLSWPRVALASFAGFAVSLNFGSLLGGTSVRFRLYSAWGMSAIDITRVVLIVGVTFWIGLFALAGVVFLFRPFVPPPELGLPFTTARPLGVMCLAIAVGYLILTGIWHRPLRLRGMSVKLPGPGAGLLQLTVAAADMVVAAACFHVLLPADSGISFVQFLSIYLLALVAVVVTHVPGGVGVFEAIVLNLTLAQNKAAIVAAVLLYRVIYYLLPLLVAAVLFGFHELMIHHAAYRRSRAAAGKPAGEKTGAD